MLRDGHSWARAEGGEHCSGQGSGSGLLPHRGEGHSGTVREALLGTRWERSPPQQPPSTRKAQTQKQQRFGLRGEPRRGECLEQKRATQRRGRKRFAEQTCHIFKGECCWGIATGITLLIPHPSLVQILHEAVLVGPGSTRRQHRVVTGDCHRQLGHALCVPLCPPS